MLLKDNKKGLVTLIMKRMKGGGDMSPSFGSEMPEKSKMKDGAEMDNETGYDACCEGMIEAVKSGDSKKFKSQLKSFVSMMMDEYEQNEDD